MTVFSYVAMSLDGYIAKPDGDISFLSKVEREGEDYGYADFIKEIDTIILGRKTYDKVLSLGFNYPADKDIIVITRNPKPDNGNIRYYGGPLGTLISELGRMNRKNIFCDGGSEVINELLQDNLIDELIISIIPTLLGEGIPLFKSGRPAMDISLKSSSRFGSGLVQLHYVRDLT